VQIPTTQAS
jgi:hypothetical protein